jgi:hypothetical protein
LLLPNKAIYRSTFHGRLSLEQKPPQGLVARIVFNLDLESTNRNAVLLPSNPDPLRFSLQGLFLAVKILPDHMKGAVNIDSEFQYYRS